MSFGNEVGTSGPGGGYGAGHNSTSGGGTRGGSSSSGNFADSVDTGGVAPGQGKGLSANDGRGGTSGSGTNGGSVRGSSRASTSSRLGSDDGVSTSAIDAARSVTGVSMGDVTAGAIASFGDFASQADTQLGPDNRGYGNATYGGDNAMANASEAAAMTRDQHTRSLESAGVPDAIQARAKPGLIGRALSIGGGMMNPLAGLAADTAGRAYSASNEIGSLNDQFGTSLDASFSNSLGKQAVGNVAGMAGGKVGQTVGAGLLSGANPYAAVAGAMAGGMAGTSLARGAAMEGMGPGQEGESSAGSGPGEGVGNGGGADQGGTRIASVPTTPTPSGNSRPDFGPTDFNGYASYAQQFFA